MNGTWAEDAGERVGTRFRATARPLALRLGGLWATARTDYAPRLLPPGFEVRTVALAGAARRLALGAGRGRPLLILPGLYADLDEGLFSWLASRAFEAGRTVALLEDRFAEGTLRLNGPAVPTLAALAREAEAAAGLLGEPPDVLALSAGAVAVLSGTGEAFARTAAFSAAVDPDATHAHLRRHALSFWYFRRVHRRAYAGADLPAPSFEAILEALAAGGPPARCAGPLLLVHAANDPVAPARAVTELPLGPGQARCLLQGGGHLGFAAVADPALYLVPFASP